MTSRPNHSLSPRRAAAPLALLALGLALSACAQMNDNMTSAFADPSKYDLYDCKQLETERKNLTAKAAELQGLMAKAETGVAGSLVSEMAYRNDYMAVRGQSRNADEAWRRNRCRETPPDKAEAGAKPVPPSRAGRAVY